MLLCKTWATAVWWSLKSSRWSRAKDNRWAKGSLMILTSRAPWIKSCSMSHVRHPKISCACTETHVFLLFVCTKVLLFTFGYWPRPENLLCPLRGISHVSSTTSSATLEAPKESDMMLALPWLPLKMCSLSECHHHDWSSPAYMFRFTLFGPESKLNISARLSASLYIHGSKHKGSHLRFP